MSRPGGVERGKAVGRVPDGSRRDPRQSPWQPRWATGSRVRNTSHVTLIGATGAVTAAACAHLDGRAVAVTGGVDGMVRVWDLATSTSIGESITAHTDAVTAVACTQLESRPIAVTGGRDHMVQVWDLSTSALVNLLPAHTGPVTAVACTHLDGRPIAVTSAEDLTVRVDHRVELRGAHPHATAVERGVGPTVDHRRAPWGDLDPVAVAP